MSVLMVELVPMKAMPYDLHHIKPHRLIWADPSIQGDNTDIHIIFRTYLTYSESIRIGKVSSSVLSTLSFTANWGSNCDD